jgi:hypothetical protein
MPWSGQIAVCCTYDLSGCSLVDPHADKHREPGMLLDHGLCLPLELSAQLATVRELVAYLASIPEMRQSDESKHALGTLLSFNAC